MNRERERELLRQFEAQNAADSGPRAERSAKNAASAYTCPERFAREREVLFRGLPNLIGLSAECAKPGDFLAADLGGIPVLVVRQPDQSLRGFVNACRHRGAPLASGPAGTFKRAIGCPYHGWTYDLDGRLRQRPSVEAAFEDVPKESCSLHAVSVGEAHGLIFASAKGKGALDVDAALHGAEAELESYGLEGYCPIETRVYEQPFNWKLVVDTFTESYHIPWLHKATIAPHYYYDRSLFDAYGPHVRFIGLRKSLAGELEKPEPERRLLPHATTQYLLLPNAVLCHQIDHVELWRVTPLAPDRTRVATSLFAPGEPKSDKERRYWIKNLDVLLDVTNREDFPLMARIQQNLMSGAMPEVVYGKLEPALQHFHASIDAALAG